ncbi:MAG TPA: NAD+ kinase [Thermoanaerobaculia bacterium]|nr:NAD+ kinase [Thermoanaerobaculia bacterium]
MSYGRILIVRRATRLEELIARFNTKGQARFYIESAGGDFADYDAEDAAYRRSLDEVEHVVRGLAKVHVIDRGFLPNYLFADDEMVVVVGQDGLVANTAKYALARPIVGVNPEPSRYDGVLLPFDSRSASDAVRAVLSGHAAIRPVSMAEARLNDGQRLLAFNDFFIGIRTHVSARYRISAGGREEVQSSSGVLVSTGAGSTGWLSSMFNMAAGIGRFAGSKVPVPKPLSWSARELRYVVREPFASRATGATIVAGRLGEGEAIELESHMPTHGVIFSDGIEADFLHFNSGAIAHVSLAAVSAQLVGK